MATHGKTDGSRFYFAAAADQSDRFSPAVGKRLVWMAILLAIHLGVVMALFLTIPYGKFAHGFYRCAALLKWAIEKRRGKQAGVTDN